MNPKYRQKKTCVSRIISITAVKTFVGTLIGLGLAAVSVPAFAQLEEIIVTAQKREQSITYINNLSFFKLDIYNEQGATYGLSLTYNIN